MNFSTTALVYVGFLLMSLFSKSSSYLASKRKSFLYVTRSTYRFVSKIPGGDITHKTFLKTVAKAPMVPKRLNILLDLLDEDPDEEIVPPTDRDNLNPFLVPLSRYKKSSSATNDILCYMRWPTQKDNMELQLVRTTEAGITLVGMDTDTYLLRRAVELDYFGKTDDAQKILDRLNVDEPTPRYAIGDYLPFFKSGKFPTLSEEDKRIVLDKFLLTKVGHFPDCYDRIAHKFLKAKNEVSALVTCERAISVFYGWGAPSRLMAEILTGLNGRELEAKDAARSAMGMPVFTIANDMKQLERCATTAGYSGLSILGEMHDFRSKDPRTDDVGEGLSPMQVTLDQAAHLIDAVGYGVGTWAAARPLLVEKYKEGGYADMADFIAYQ